MRIYSIKKNKKENCTSRVHINEQNTQINKNWILENTINTN